jgi:uncharacterized protein (TIGR03435 family)
MMTRWLLLSVVLAACVPSAHAQAPGTAAEAKPLEFDVATIKPIEPGGRPTKGWVGVQSRADGMSAAYQSLPDLLCYAYGYKSLRFDGQIAGAPDWAATQRFDVEAKMSAADLAEFQKLSKDEQQQRREAMMQSLLAERFHLTVHRGSKQVPVYELVVAKGGIKMKDAATDPDPLKLSKDADGKPLPGIRWLEKTSVAQAYSMSSLADLLSMPAAQVGRPVIDKTGLTGAYNFTFDWSIYSAAAAARSGTAESDPASDVPTIFTALGEIGLKLEASTGGMPTIVIDHVEMPSEN